MSPTSLSLFHPLIQKWFTASVGAPTDVQERAWPEIAAARHVLVIAPTGCGKTLAAFLWALNQLITGAWQPGGVRVLYLSPLKALNNDVQKNLLGPLAGLRRVFEEAGEQFPNISVLTRSGDTPGEERRRMAKRPPEILITTPESLNLLVTSRSGRSMLTTVATVILDEIHAVVGTKRGTHLITAVDRLVPLAGEFQRIALSATVNPAERVAAFVGGFRRIKAADEDIYEKRPVAIARSIVAKSYDLQVRFPADAREKLVDGSWWPALIDDFAKLVAGHRSTLFFANSRRSTEKVTRLINEQAGEDVAYSHHGSLSREIRLAVEQKLKQGELRAIVATNSLELGIDIGSLDQVVLIQTPRSVSSTLQRIGRSGHGVGETSRGLLYPTHGRDFIDAAVVSRMALGQDIEEVHPIEAPLDILAQVVLSMTSVERWNIDDLYGFLRTSYPFRDLARKHFDQVLEMLAGRYSDSRLRELRPRISFDRVDNTVQANPEVPYLLATSGGTIPDRGYFALRVAGTHAKIGELDEEFVWERSLGDTFTLGTQVWRIEKITHNDVEVTAAASAPGIFPFWKAEEQDRDFHLSEAIGLFLEQADQRLDDPQFASELKSGHGMDEASTSELLSFLKLQKETTGSRLPHRHHLLVEEVEDPQAKGERKQIIAHTFWGNRVNRPFGLALCQAWEEREGTPIQLVTTDDALLFMLPRAATGQDLLSLVTPENVEPLLRKKLEQTGFFGARFRENAERALLLPKASFKRRTPLWLIRLRAKELLAAISRYDDFPIVLETWRTCLRDEFDLEHLTGLLEELREGTIVASSVRTAAASPFAGNLVWKQTNKYMYDDDTPLARPGTAERADLIKDVLFSPHLRPKVPQELADQLDRKLKRVAEGYAPASARELLDWVKERLLVPEEEWQKLRSAILRDVGADGEEWLREENRKLLWLSWPGLGQRMLTALESLPKVLVAFRLLLDDAAVGPADPSDTEANTRRRAKTYLKTAPTEAAPDEAFDLSQFLSAWLAYYGPLEKTRLERLLAIPTGRLDEALGPLVESQEIVADQFLETSSSLEVCDSGNLAMLLRMARRLRRPSFEALPLADLTLFLAQFQGLAVRGSSIEDLQQRIEQLFGWPAPAGAWEEHLLPARMNAYRSEWLDSLLATSDLLWFGCGEKRLSLCFSQDLELFRLPAHGSGADGHLAQLIPDRRGRYSFLEIAQFSHLDTVHAAEEIWKEAWKGHVTSDSFRVVRKGVQTGFRTPAANAEERMASRRSGFNRWKATRPLEGNWLRIDSPAAVPDLLAEEELAKDRLRQLFKRYGVLFRELLANELPLLQWRSLFRQLRLMELSGEVLSGYFFSGLSGPQFASPEAFRMLRDGLKRDRLFRLNATDPASLCGILPGLPPRVASNDLVYQGSELVMLSRRHGRALEIFIQPGDSRLQDSFGLLAQFLTREFAPLQKVVVETVNNEPVQKSPYADALKAFGFRQSRSVLELWKEVR